MRPRSYRTWPGPVPENPKYSPISIRVWHYMRLAGGVHTAEHLETKLKVSRKSIKRALSFLAERRHVVLREWWTRGGRRAYWSYQITLHDGLVPDLGMGTFSEVPVPVVDLGKGTSLWDYARGERRRAARHGASMSPCHDHATPSMSCENTPSEGVAEGSALYRPSTACCSEESLVKNGESSGGEAAQDTPSSSASSAPATTGGARATAAPSQASPTARLEVVGARRVASGGAQRGSRSLVTRSIPKAARTAGTFDGWTWDPTDPFASDTNRLYESFLKVLADNGDELPKYHERIKANISAWFSQGEGEADVALGLARLFDHNASGERFCDNPGNPLIFEQKFDRAMRGSGSLTSQEAHAIFWTLMGRKNKPSAPTQRNPWDEEPNWRLEEMQSM